jgi:predicted nucleic acid-binding protein
VIHLDTSVLIDAFTGPKRSAPALRGVIERGERVVFSTIVLYEWLRGPRAPAELAAQEALFPRETAIAFGPEEASVAAKLYHKLKRGRGREIDLAIAGTAIVHDSTLWTLNTDDFDDVESLSLCTPESNAS